MLRIICENEDETGYSQEVKITGDACLVANQIASVLLSISRDHADLMKLVFSIYEEKLPTVLKGDELDEV